MFEILQNKTLKEMQALEPGSQVWILVLLLTNCGGWSELPSAQKFSPVKWES